MCYFDYVCSSWYSGLSQKFKKQLQITQNKTFCFIVGVGPHTRIGQDELNQVRMLNTQDRVAQLKLNHVFNFNFNNTSPEYFTSNFTQVSSFHNYSIRGSPYNFFVPYSKNHSSFTFYNMAIHHWNSLPKQHQSHFKFKYVQTISQEASC